MEDEDLTDLPALPPVVLAMVSQQSDERDTVQRLNDFFREKDITDANLINDYKISLLCSAIAHNHGNLSSHLIETVSIDLTCKAYPMPLHMAVSRGQKDLAEKLVVNGSPLHVESTVSSESWKSTKRTPLCIATAKDDVECMVVLLDKYDTVREPNRQSPLHLASMHTARQCMKYLMDSVDTEAGVVNATNADGETPLHLLVRSPNCTSDDVKRLLSHGADPNAQDPTEHHTPLHVAALSEIGDNYVGKMEALIEGGSDLKATRIFKDETAVDILIGKLCVLWPSPGNESQFLQALTVLLRGERLDLRATLEAALYGSFACYNERILSFIHGQRYGSDSSSSMNQYKLRSQTIKRMLGKLLERHCCCTRVDEKPVPVDLSSYGTAIIQYLWQLHRPEPCVVPVRRLRPDVYHMVMDHIFDIFNLFVRRSRVQQVPPDDFVAVLSVDLEIFGTFLESYLEALPLELQYNYVCNLLQSSTLEEPDAANITVSNFCESLLETLCSLKYISRHAILRRIFWVGKSQSVETLPLPRSLKTYVRNSMQHSVFSHSPRTE